MGKLLILLSAILFFGCSGEMPHETSPKHLPTVEERDINEFVMHTEMAHKKYAFQSKGAVEFDLKLFFRGTQRMEAHFTLLTNAFKGKIEQSDGTTLVYNEMENWVISDTIVDNDQRFDTYTWSYFFLLPYKLSDPGTVFSSFENNTLNDTIYDTQKLSFESGTGDAPDDWYVLYADQNTALLHAAAYIVTANKSVAEAEQDPHAITYENYTLIDDLPIATKWTFWEWREMEGLTTQLGYAELSNIRFSSPRDAEFVHP